MKIMALKADNPQYMHQAGAAGKQVSIHYSFPYNT